MPPYIGKKALKLQRIEAERMCMHHPTWQRLFFLESTVAVENWLLSPDRQPVLHALSLDELQALDDVILPVRRDEVFSEYYRVMYCRDVMEQSSLSVPATTYERLVECLFERSVVDDPCGDTLNVRPLLGYRTLLQARQRSVRFLTRLLEKYTVFCEEDVVELEKYVSVYAWNFMRTHMPSFDRLDDFLKSYDLWFANIVGFATTTEDDDMHTLFVNLLFVRKQHEYLVQNHFQVMKTSKWTPVADLVNRSVERLTLEANSDYYVCRKCKRKDTNVQSLQLRSSDEPATIIVTCVHCYYRFTAHN